NRRENPVAQRAVGTSSFRSPASVRQRGSLVPTYELTSAVSIAGAPQGRWFVKRVFQPLHPVASRPGRLEWPRWLGAATASCRLASPLLTLPPYGCDSASVSRLPTLR